MPKTPCPACKINVKYSTDADGDTVTCPECDEVFSPPNLRKKVKKYDPTEDEDVYTLTRGGGSSASDARERDKSRHAASAMEGAMRDERARAARRRRPKWYDGPEVWLLIFAVGAGAGLPFGIWLARNWQKMSDAKVFWLFLLLIAVGIAAAGLGGSAWAWLRRNR
ncbi:MAG: hypothetical protein K2V38_24535 [Gemmataceae bacterium]|nr:hypothetical protein [Gemmataceae bacterium]